MNCALQFLNNQVRRNSTTRSTLIIQSSCETCSLHMSGHSMSWISSSDFRRLCGWPKCVKITEDIIQSQHKRKFSHSNLFYSCIYSCFFFSLPHEVLAICKVKEIPSFLSCFEALCIGLAPWIEPATTRSAVKRSTDWTSLAAIKTLYPLNKSKCNERPTYIRECVGEILNRSLSSSHIKKTKIVNNNNLKKHSHYLPSRLPW